MELDDLVKELVTFGGGAAIIYFGSMTLNYIRRELTYRRLQRFMVRDDINDSTDLIKKVANLQSRIEMDDELAINKEEKHILNHIPLLSEILQIPKIIYNQFKYIITNYQPNFVIVQVGSSDNGVYNIGIRLNYDQGKKTYTYSIESKSNTTLMESLNKAIQFLERRRYRVGVIS